MHQLLLLIYGIIWYFIKLVTPKFNLIKMVHNRQIFYSKYLAHLFKFCAPLYLIVKKHSLFLYIFYITRKTLLFKSTLQVICFQFVVLLNVNFVFLKFVCLDSLSTHIPVCSFSFPDTSYTLNWDITIISSCNDQFSETTYKMT